MIHDSLVCTSARVSSLLKTVKLMTNNYDEIHSGRDWMSNHPKPLLKPERATRFWISFTQEGMVPTAEGIVGLSRSSVEDPVELVCLTPSSKMVVGQLRKLV